MALLIVRRILYMVVLLAVLSVVAFLIIQLPPGDWVTTFVYQMQQRGIIVDDQMMQSQAVRLRPAAARAVPEVDRQHHSARRLR